MTRQGKPTQALDNPYTISPYLVIYWRGMLAGKHHTSVGQSIVDAIGCLFFVQLEPILHEPVRFYTDRDHAALTPKTLVCE